MAFSTASAGIDSREAALDVFRAVLRNRQPLDLVLTSDERFNALPSRDRAFARRIVSSAFRRLGQVDAVVAHCLDRALPEKAGIVQDVLRLAAVQILFADAPPHAAVDTAVEITRRRRMEPFARVVNAVLRRITREGDHLISAQDTAMLNTPEWLRRSWEAAYGVDAARRIAEAHLMEPPLDLTVKDPAESSRWAAATGAQETPTGGLRRPAGGAVPEMPGFAEGAWWVQDCAAALPARMLGDVSGKRIVDLAAAPGGKTAQLAAAGAHVTAVDIAEKRLRLVEENLTRLGLTAELVTADATKWSPSERFDGVLLDAPCTATGTIRRHPDIAWLKSKADVERLAGLQDRLLDAAVKLAKPGARLVYACCSLEPEEGPERVAALLTRNPAIARDPLSADEVAGLSELVTSDGDLRTLPYHMAASGGMDGFYAARLRVSA